MAQQLGTSWATLGNLESYSFYSDGLPFDFEYAIDGYYEKISNTTVRIHLRAWIKANTGYSWTDANKSWRIWCTDGASFDTSSQNDSAYIDSNGHHLPNDNGVSFDITQSGYFSGATFNVHFNYEIPYASQDHTLDRSVSIRTSGIYVPYNTKSKSPIKAFAPVQGKSKEALKIYRGDANNKSKIIYTKG